MVGLSDMYDAVSSSTIFCPMEAADSGGIVPSECQLEKSGLTTFRRLTGIVRTACDSTG
jgi:hypothetical protein